MVGVHRLTPFDFLIGVDLLATAIFAATGALVASRKELDIFGFIWLAAATGVGGGTLRDLILGVPVFWVANPAPLIICVSLAVLLHFGSAYVLSRLRLIVLFDAFGMAFAAVAGTAKALEIGANGLVAIVMGLFSATAGGIIRDTLGHEPSIILRREIYMTAAVLGATVVVMGHLVEAPRLLSLSSGFLVALSLRILAIKFNLTLPAFKSRPPDT